MTDYENKDLTGQNTVPNTEVTQAAEEPQAPETEPQQAAETPHLTLEPDPAPPVDPVPEIPMDSAEAFQMPEPPRAPEPPKAQPPQPPEYAYTPPQYTAPQYQSQPYGQPAPQMNYNYKPLYNVPPVGYAQKSRIAAGLLGILFGVFGVHNFYLGNNTRAVIQLIVALVGGLFSCGVATIAVEIWGLIEGIQILSASPTHLYDGNGVILKD